MTHEEKALSYFKDKFHCSQSVLAAYADELGLTEEQALKIAYCFNAGMRKGEVCGACSGALMVLGMLYGQADKDDLDSRNCANQMTDRFLILGCDITTQEGVEYAVKHELFTTTCRDMVALAVQVLEEIIE